MAPGDVRPVPDSTGVHYLDTGMYDVAGYGAVYVIAAAEPAVVDTGIGTHHDRVLDALDAVGIDRDELAHVLPTHVHLDHAGGAGFLADACPNATVRTHERGVPHLIDPGRLVEGTKAAVGDQWEYYVDPEPVPEGRIEPLADGDAVDLGDRRLRVTAAPGHAPHQVTFHDDRDDLLFTGDAAGIYAPGPDRLFPTTPPPQFDLDRCIADVETMREQDPDTLCYAHFGPIAYEPAVLDGYERVLRDWVDRVRAVHAETGDTEETVARLAADPDPDAVAAWGERKAAAEARLNARGVLAALDEGA
jgi:glyoxylase-like metal-dependent hydrolase (beta-lactamase superfamily II)